MAWTVDGLRKSPVSVLELIVDIDLVILYACTVKVEIHSYKFLDRAVLLSPGR